MEMEISVERKHGDLFATRNGRTWRLRTTFGLEMCEEIEKRDGEIERLTAERDEATSALSRERVEVERLREAIYKAASAPGRDWLAEQLELGRVLGDTEHKGGSDE